MPRGCPDRSQSCRPYSTYRTVEGGVAGPRRVVRVGQWRPEERHDPVPRHPVDRTLVAMDRLHHVIENRVQELVGLLGVALREQLHRTLHVGEEDRDLLPLALKCGPRRQDALRQMLGGVGSGWRTSVRGRVGELPTARPAETLPAGDLGTAVRAGPGEPCAALLAESRCPGVRSLAPWTPHGRSRTMGVSMLLVLGRLASPHRAKTPGNSSTRIRPKAVAVSFSVLSIADAWRSRRWERDWLVFGGTKSLIPAPARPNR